jgi:hypothetical protein
MGTVAQTAAAPWVVTHLVMPNPDGWLMFAAVVAVAGFAMAVVVDFPRRRPAFVRDRCTKEVDEPPP